MRYLASPLVYPHVVGLLIGTVFFAFSLTPSLLPRPILIQGILSGLSFSAGYGLGSVLLWLWSYLQLPSPHLRWARAIQLVASVLCLIFVLHFAWQAAEWQNALRDMMGLELLTDSQPFYLGLIVALVFLLMLAVARLFKWALHALAVRWQHYIPPRISYLTSFVVVLLLFWSVIDGVLINSLMRTANNSFKQLDALIDDHLPRPTAAYQTGRFSLVTMLQLGADTMFGIAPKGFGHEYAPEHYIDAWLGLTEPEGWDERSIQRLKVLFQAQQGSS